MRSTFCKEMKSALKIVATIFIVLFPPILAWHTFVHPVISYIGARDWIATETTSLTVRARSSQGKTHTGVEYTFEHSQGIGSGDTVQFWPGSYRNTVDPGLIGVSALRVWYDPLNPRRSVLFRDFSVIGFAFGLIPFAFSMLSFWVLVGLISAAFKTRKEDAEQVGASDGDNAPN